MRCATRVRGQNGRERAPIGGGRESPLALGSARYRHDSSSVIGLPQPPPFLQDACRATVLPRNERSDAVAIPSSRDHWEGCLSTPTHASGHSTGLRSKTRLYTELKIVSRRLCGARRTTPNSRSPISKHLSAWNLGVGGWRLVRLCSSIQVSLNQRNAVRIRRGLGDRADVRIYVTQIGLETDEGAERIKAAYGANYERLVALKNRYDPTNLFRHTQNIKPTA